MEKPNLIIVGAIKCGTTSLYKYLDNHPEVSMAKVKEVEYFSKNFDNPWEWYTKHFEFETKIIGEASPHYTWSKDLQVEVILDRIKDKLPNVKIIYITRNPLKQVISLYKHAVYYWMERRHIKDVLKVEENNPFVYYSKHYQVAQSILKRFDIDQFYTLSIEELNANPILEMKHIYKFLGVEEIETPNSKIAYNTFEGRKYLNAFGRQLDLLPSPICRLIHILPDFLIKTDKMPHLNKEHLTKLANYFEDDWKQYKSLKELVKNKTINR